MADFRGATLLELIIAVAMVTIAVVIISLTFPKASATLTGSRHRLLASRFVDSRMQELKAQAYAYVPISSGTVFSSALPFPCYCRTIDMEAMPGADAVMTDSGITFTRKVCVNLADPYHPDWESACPDGDPPSPATDKGFKAIRIRVSWTAGNQNYFTESEGLVTR